MVALDRDDMRRTLVRIAHEIVEKNPDGAVALVGIHRRGAHLAKRLQPLTSELLDSAVPLGSVDIAFYRDDLSLRSSSPVVHATELDFSLDGRTIVIVDDVLYTGRTVRAAIEAVFDYGRPARGCVRCHSSFVGSRPCLRAASTHCEWACRRPSERPSG